MRIIIDGKTYQGDAITKLSLGDVLRFNRWSTANDMGVMWADIEGMLSELSVLSDEDRRRHPGSVWLLALTVWQARRAAGEDLDFGEAIDSVPALDSSRVKFLPDPSDRKPRKAPGKAKARTPRASAAG